MPSRCAAGACTVKATSAQFTHMSECAYSVSAQQQRHLRLDELLRELDSLPAPAALKHGRGQTRPLLCTPKWRNCARPKWLLQLRKLSHIFWSCSLSAIGTLIDSGRGKSRCSAVDRSASCLASSAAAAAAATQCSQLPDKPKLSPSKERCAAAVSVGAVKRTTDGARPTAATLLLRGQSERRG